MTYNKFPLRVWIDQSRYVPGADTLGIATLEKQVSKDIEYLSLTEHQAIVAKLEERLKVAKIYLKSIEYHTVKYSGVAGNQCLFDLVKNALEMMGEE